MFDIIMNAFCEFVVHHPRRAALVGLAVFLVVALLENPH